MSEHVSPLVMVLSHPRVRGGIGTIEASQELISKALGHKHATDAHCQACASSARPHSRLVAADVGKVHIVTETLWIDVDAPGHVATDEWWASEQPKIRALLEAHPDAFIYRTRGGYRIVWVLTVPFEIRTADDCAAWKYRYLLVCDLLAGFGIEADRACSNWGHLFRLPHATRDPAHGPERLETIGAVNAIGTFTLPEAPALGVSPKVSVVSVERPEDFLLLKLLAARGDVLGKRPDGSYLIRCPRRRLHSVGHDGDSSTLLYPPRGSGYGWIRCLHNSCSEATISDWFAALSDTGTTPTLGNSLNAATLQTVLIVDAFVNDNAGGIVNVKIDLGPTIPGGLRVFSNNSHRWSALWDAAGVEPPSDVDPCGDLFDAARELVGRTISIELDGAKVRRIFPAESGGKISGTGAVQLVVQGERAP